jgi:pimeloyl-[acyl-carrier protein] methyl ester esterase
VTVAFLEVENGRRVYYEHHVGSGRPVVLIHGWAVNARCWDTTLPALLDAGHEVALLDHRACGRSDKDFADVSVAAVASDVVATVHRLGLNLPVLNGWSLGGAVAVEAAVRLRDTVGGLVLTGGATPRYTATEGWPYGGTAADTEAVLAGLAADRATTFRGVASAVCAKPVGQDVVDWTWGQFLESGPRADATLRDLIGLDQRELLGRIECPVLLMCGTEDAFVSIDGVRASRDLYRDARLVEFGGSGHAPFLEDRDSYLAQLLEFAGTAAR